ncbi:hypothetical protein [Microbulbifer sp. GL-2]|uniref:hypothetical protein n=1 Tax=Microbulbifer sp. GL-2 TaxID=2591606 RepID=UPI001164FCC7|nr:hypothetical protein [Microbulbifer sp. GL-2]BBM02427.1 hypothetical protein GL2_25010 [Microbulbifer sp. GL-2]
MTVLVCESLSFLSEGDEIAFFNWLNSLECISQIKGVNNEIQLHLTDSEISYDNLRDLIAIFTRYDVNMSQLSQLQTDENRDWFYDNKLAFWHKDVFG